MPAVAPQATVHHACALRRPGLEAGHLGISDRLEEDAEGRQRGARRVESAEGARSRHAGQQRCRDDPSQHRLQPEDQVQTLEPEMRLVAFAHLLVAAVFAVATIAQRDVEAQPQCPGDSEHHHAEAARTGGRQQRRIGQRRAADEGRPRAVRQAGVALAQAGQPGQQREADEQCQPGEPDECDMRQRRPFRHRAARSRRSDSAVR